MTDDPRDTRDGVWNILTNFNALTNRRRLIPYLDSESGNTGQSDDKIQNFCIALRTGTTYSLYGLGVVTGQAYARIFYKNLTTGAATDLDDSGWAETANNASASGAISPNCFFFYRQTGYIYFARNGSHIARYDPTGSGAIADTHQALTYTHVGQGTVHSKDDIAYIPWHNSAGSAGARSGIAKNDNGSWTNTALSLPDHYIPTSVAEYGNYLAISCSHVDGVSNSRVFLWDRDSTLETLSETIDWGDGSLMFIEEVDGVLIGASQAGGGALAFTGIPAATVRIKPRIIFRYLSVSSAIKFREILCESTSTYLNTCRLKRDNRLYFMLFTTYLGARREGVWSIGRNPGEEFTLIHERTPNNDTSLSSGTPIGFYIVGDYLFQSYTDGGVHGMSKSNDSTSYTATSIAETTIRDDGDASLEKELQGIAVMHEYLPTAGQIVIKYKKDEETSFTTIKTNTTDNSVATIATNIASGISLPKYREITFRIESTGGAVPTGLVYKSKPLTSRPF